MVTVLGGQQWPRMAFLIWMFGAKNQRDSPRARCTRYFTEREYVCECICTFIHLSDEIVI